MRATAAVVLLVPLLATLPFGPGAFAAAAVLIGVVVLIDLSGLMTAAAARPVVLAALVPVIAVPLTALGEDGWSAVPAWIGGTFALTVVFVLAFGRRSQVTEVIGGTVLAALLPTLGVGALVLLRGLPEGLAWVVGVLALCAAADAGGPLALRFQRRRRRRRQGQSPTDRDGAVEPSEAGLLGLAGAALAVAVVGLVLALVAPADISGSVVAGVALAAFAGSRAGSGALRHLAADAGLDTDLGASRFGDGVAVLASSTVLLAAPAAYVLAAAALR